MRLTIFTNQKFDLDTFKTLPEIKERSFLKGLSVSQVLSDKVGPEEVSDILLTPTSVLIAPFNDDTFSFLEDTYEKELNPVVIFPQDSNVPSVDFFLENMDPKAYNVLGDEKGAISNRALLYVIMMNLYNRENTKEDIYQPEQIRLNYMTSQIQIREMHKRCSDNYDEREFITDKDVEKLTSLPI